MSNLYLWAVREIVTLMATGRGYLLERSITFFDVVISTAGCVAVTLEQCAVLTAVCTW